MVWQWQHEGMAGGINPVVCPPAPQGCGCCWRVQDCHSCSPAQSPKDPGQQRSPPGAVAVLHGWPRYDGTLLTGNLLPPPVSRNPSLRLQNAPRFSLHDMICFQLLRLPCLHFYLVLGLFRLPLLSPRRDGHMFYKDGKDIRDPIDDNRK